jgi:hypothetical protein
MKDQKELSERVEKIETDLNNFDAALVQLFMKVDYVLGKINLLQAQFDFKKEQWPEDHQKHLDAYKEAMTVLEKYSAYLNVKAHLDYLNEENKKK